jgi:hypothetical protein
MTSAVSIQRDYYRATSSRYGQMREAEAEASVHDVDDWVSWSASGD